ncbi:MAG: RNA polymerase sigma factor [Planctomycetota bacterium]
MTLALNRTDCVLELFERHSDRILRFACRSLPPNEAEDVVQDVFATLMRVADLEHRRITISYLFKIAENLIKQRRRQNARRHELLTRLRQRRSAAQREAPVRQQPRDDDRQLQDALDSLPAHEYEALLLIVARGYGYDAAARALGVPVSTVNNWKHRGLQKLGDHFRPARAHL